MDKNTYISNMNEQVPENINKLYEFLAFFPYETNIIVKTPFNDILFTGSIMDFDAYEIKDIPIPLNYAIYSAEVSNNTLCINVRKIDISESENIE